MSDATPTQPAGTATRLRCVDDVLITPELDARPSRAPDYEAENRALRELAETMAAEPDKVLPHVAEAAMALTRADSAGVSLLEPGGEHAVFRWVATAGAFAEQLGGTMPREASPCGEVIARDAVLLLKEPGRVFPASLEAGPDVHETLLAPFHVDGKTAGMVWAIQHSPDGHFEREDARILESLARFTTAAHRMARALQNSRATERESEAGFRTLFTAMDQGFCVIEKVDTAPGEPSDFRYLSVNPAFERHTGMRDVVGRTIRELVPTAEQAVMDRYDQVVATGVPQRFEDYVEALDLWMEAEVFPASAPGRIAVLFSNISERKRAEAARRKSEERQAFLLKLSDALRPLSDPAEIQGEVTRRLLERFDVGWCYYLDLNEDLTQGVILKDAHREGLPSLVGAHDLSDIPGFIEQCESGQTLVLNSWATSPLWTPRVVELYTAMGVKSLLGAPLLKQGRLRAVLLMLDTEERNWSEDAVIVIDEVAERTWAAVERARAEAALRETEERYRTELERQVADRTAELAANRDLLQAIIDSSMDLIQVFEAVRNDTGEIVDFRWVLNNQASESRYGKLDGERLLQLNPGVREEGIFDAFRRVVETGAPEQAERHYVHEQFDGWFLQSVVKLDDGVATTTKDITEWKVAQDNILHLREEVSRAKLRASEERLSLALEATDLGVWEWDLATDRVTANQHFRDHFGLGPEEPIIAATLMERVHSEDRSHVDEVLRRAMAADSDGRYRFEYRLRAAASAGERWIDAQGQVHFAGAGSEQRAVRVLGTTLDVTERKRTEEVMRESEKRQAFLLKLSDALRPLADTAEITGMATRVLGEWLSASRAYYAEWPRGENYAEVTRDYAEPGLPSLAGRYPIDVFRSAYDRMSQGRTWIVADAAADTVMDAAEREYYLNAGVTAWIDVPLIKRGQVEAALCIVQDTPRHWTETEIMLVEEAAERCWAAVERARAEAALRESEEHLRQFSEASTNLLWTRNAETLQWELLSPAFEDIYGISREEALAGDNYRTWQDFIVPEDRAHALAEIARVRAGERVTFEYRIRRPSDGGVRWLRNSDFPILDSSGRVARIGGIGQDVTLIKQVQQALSESEERLTAVFESLPVGLGVLDAEGTLILSNPEMRRFLPTGLMPSRDSEGVRRWRAYHPDGRPAPPQEFPGARAMRGEAVIPGLEMAYLLDDGTEVWTRVSAVPVRGRDGAVNGAVAVVTDIDALKRAEEGLRELNATLERRVRERTAELANANHELAEEVRQRVRAEAARREILRRLVTAEEDERRRISRELHDHMGQLVTGLVLGLRALGLETDGGAPGVRVRELEQLAGRIARELQHTALELRPPALDSLGLTAALQNHLDEWSQRHAVACDFHAAGMDGDRLPPEMETTIYRVVQEGLTNILKHAGATHVGLVLERRAGCVTTILEDDGRGFDPDAVLASREKAKRLGLRGMRERIALLRGTLEIESSPAGGTTLFVRIPDDVSPDESLHGAGT